MISRHPVRRRSSIYDARIAGLYDLEETIGKGHYAVVKLAKHVFTGEKVAVKVIDKTKLDAVSTAHLMQEVTCMKLVQHPHIVRLYEVIDTQSKLFLILELADCDLYEYITKHEKGVTEAEAQLFFRQIVEAIDYCHLLHVVHRDLKAENVVFFGDSKTVKLTDFGFSNLFTPGQQLETSCGSLAYSAPEILLGDAYDAPAVDVWSLGVILFMLVSGSLPFQAANDSETLTKIMDCDFRPPSHLSQQCQELIRLLLVRDPAKRASVSQIVEHPWVQSAKLEHKERLPLISKAKVSQESHQLIVEQMVAGGISDCETIHTALESDEYSYVTATYYLLAERVLKRQSSEGGDLLNVMAKSDSQLDLASLALSPRVAEKGHAGRGVACTCPNPDECSCPTQETGESSSEHVDVLVSPVDQVPPLWPLNSSNENPVGGRRGSWRQRVCSIVKEESEEELDKYLKTSRSASPPLGALSGGRAGEIAAIQIELAALTSVSGRLSGRRTPDRTLSRSPSPGGSVSSGTTSPIVGRLKSATGSSLRKLSSSPHLRGICEESEEDSNSLSGTEWSKRPTVTYSSVRMIRPRQAVVSPDVIRRYERVYGSGGTRSRRSTSCSSSEASDDDSERRLGLIASKHCRRDGSDHDDDTEPPAAGGGREGHIRGKIGLPASNGGTHTHTSSTDAKPRAINGGKKKLDASKLIGKLQTLVLAPIKEVPPVPFLAIRSKSVQEEPKGIKRLIRAQSCETLLSPSEADEYLMVGNAEPPFCSYEAQCSEEEKELTGGEMSDDEAEESRDLEGIAITMGPHKSQHHAKKLRKRKRQVPNRRCREMEPMDSLSQIKIVS